MNRDEFREHCLATVAEALAHTWTVTGERRRLLYTVRGFVRQATDDDLDRLMTLYENEGDSRMASNMTGPAKFYGAKEDAALESHGFSATERQQLKQMGIAWEDVLNLIKEHGMQFVKAVVQALIASWVKVQESKVEG